MSKQALLGKVMNLGKSDIVQSVTPGDADAAIDWRGISNFIKTKRVNFTWTQTDADNGLADIEVVWDVPFPDANYTVVIGVNDLSGTLTTNGAWVGDFHFLTAASLNAIIYEYSAGAFIPVGSKFVLHVIAIHD